MSDKSLNAVSGVGLALLTALAGGVVAIMLTTGGNVHADAAITLQVVIVALGSAVLFPTATVRFLPTKWWVAALVFCPLLPLALIAGILGQDWLRCLVALSSIAAAFASAWQFKPRNPTRLP